MIEYKEGSVKDVGADWVVDFPSALYTSSRFQGNKLCFYVHFLQE